MVKIELRHDKLTVPLKHLKPGQYGFVPEGQFAGPGMVMGSGYILRTSHGAVWLHSGGFMGNSDFADSVEAEPLPGGAVLEITIEH
jgi:hypothetical protein